MTINKKQVLIASFIYIYFPIIIFLLGFIRLYISAPIIVILGFVAYKTIRDGFQYPEDNISVSKLFFILGILFLLLISYFTGWGRWVKQSFDWYKHNAVLSDLIEHSWPVYYENGSEKSMLSYYIGQYLVPAVAGKIAAMFTDAKLTVTTVPDYRVFSGIGEGAVTLSDAISMGYVAEIPVSFRIAEIIQFLWNTFGLLLVWMNLMLTMKLKSVKAHIVELAMFIFFSVPQSLVEIFVYGIYGLDCVNKNYILSPDNEIILQYTGNYRSLIGAFAQIIVPWLVVMIFLNNRDNIRFYLFYMLPLMLFAPLPMIGLVPIAIGHSVFRFFKYVKEKQTAKWFGEIFSIENLLCLFSLGTVMVLYLYGNVFEPKPDSLVFRMMRYREMFGIYPIFIIINILLYTIFIVKNMKPDHLFYISIAELIILPLFRMGYFNDLNLRASVPALMIVMCYLIKCVVQGFNRLKEKKTLLGTVLYIALIALLYNGMSYQIQRMEEHIVEEDYTSDADLYTYGTMEFFADRTYENMSDAERKQILLDRHPEMSMSQEFTVDLVYNYYSYDIEENMFYKYLAGKKIGD